MDGFTNAFPRRGKAFCFAVAVGFPALTRLLARGMFPCSPLVTVGIALLSVFLHGCGRPVDRADIVIINGGEPETLDPAIVTVQADLRLVRALFEGLVRLNVKAEPEPGLAYRWDISPDGLRYTFYLRSNLVWSTGEPITSADVLYSWRRVLNPMTAADYAGQLYFVRNGREYNIGKLTDPDDVGIQVLDPLTIQVDLVAPTPFFLSLCTFPTLAIVPQKAIERHGDRWTIAKPLPVSGAYQLDFWRLQDRIRMRKNPL